MRQTFRTFTWEWGCVIVVLGGLAYHAIFWSSEEPLSSWINIFSAVVYLPFSVYWLRLILKYPRRSDLPEFQEWAESEATLRHGWTGRSEGDWEL
jgi:hypothetical protein